MDRILRCAVLFLLISAVNVLQAQISSVLPKPAGYFGFEPGSDRNLFTYEKLISYLEILDTQSERLKLIQIGESPMGRPIFIACISTAENIANIDRLKEINRRLALDPEIPEEQLQTMLKEGKVFILSTLSMHSGEVGPSQAAPKVAWQLLSTTDPDTLGWLKNTVLMMVPCHNPDGMDMIVKHYYRYKGTPEEGASMPGVYHKYVGHDNNRDFVTLSQSDTRAIAGIYNKEWFPQVMVEKHQMGSTGPRYFVPPPHDPIAENIDARIWNWIGLFGANMQKDMTADGLEGISQHYLFDDYWPGSTETCIWKNVIGFLTEAASVHYATPVFIEPTELKVYGKGLSEYKKSINMPLPWEGGWWRLSDIVDLEISSTMSIIKTSSINHDKILRFRNAICVSETVKGKTEPPYYYIIPQNQHDKSEYLALIKLLLEHGLKLFKLKHEIMIERHLYAAGDVVVPLAQPFRSFVKEVFEKQEFPVRHYTPEGEMIKPYDITSWSLPLHRGVEVAEINVNVTIPDNHLTELSESPVESFVVPEETRYLLFSVNHNESFRAAFMANREGITVNRITKSLENKDGNYPAGSFMILKGSGNSSAVEALLESLTVTPGFMAGDSEIETDVLNFPKIGLVETYFHDMDAGWTRFVFDSYGVSYTVLRPHQLAEKKIKDSFDVLVFPDAPESILMDGKWKSGDRYYISSYPAEYTRGMGKKGMENVVQFLIDGGHIISWGESARLFTGTLTIRHSEKESEEFQLPVRDISEGLAKEGLYVPGSFVQVHLPYDHPLSYGMPGKTGIFFRGEPVFSTSVPNLDTDRRVIARFPETDIVLSGYSEKEKLLGNKVAMTWIKKGRGQLTLFAFRPQFRASTQATYKLLFNALLLD